MKTLILINAVFNIPEWIIVVIIAPASVVLLIIFIYYLYELVFKTDLKRRRLCAMNTMINEEQRHSDATEKTDQEQTQECETTLIREELLEHNISDEMSKVIANMTLEELLQIKEKIKKENPKNFIINTITHKVLIETEFEQRKDIKNLRVPKDITLSSASGIKQYIKTLQDVETSGRCDNKMYKINGENFALLCEYEGKYCLTVKMGLQYGHMLKLLYADYISSSKFPYGTMCLNMKTGCSLELVKLALLISYNIAKAGY